MKAHERCSLAELSAGTWDVIILGGGITGAAVFREAAGLGLRALLVERDDFASGTSSHSAKLVHGGLHYLSRFQLGLARESIRERDLLLQERAGLVESIDFVLPVATGDRRHAYVTSVGLGVYQAMSGRLHRAPHVDRGELARVAPGLDDRYDHALRYTEGQTDDARLTLRVIADGQRDGGIARNYTEATSLLRGRNGQITGIELRDGLSGDAVSVRARHIVNATGPWSDRIRSQVGFAPRQRMIGGSHLVFPQSAFPLHAGMAVYHPSSGHPLYLVPWRGVTIVGTTHVEAEAETDQPAAISPEEISYLLAGAQELFPDLHLTASDVQATFSGFRPIVDTNTTDPARASRDAGIWLENGLLTVTGGKLTTHRAMARQVMRRIAPRLARWTGHQAGEQGPKIGRPADTELHSREIESGRLAARFGSDFPAYFASQPEEERLPIPELGGASLAELRWSMRYEQVAHLDDLLVRRSRIVLLAPNGGIPALDRIEPVVREELGWGGPRWESEVCRYQTFRTVRYAVPPPRTAPLTRDAQNLPRAS